MKRRKDEAEDERPDAPGAEGGDDSGEAELREALAVAQRERDELLDKYRRALADQENARKRHQREMDDARRYGVAALARELLGVVDNLQRALDGVPAERGDDPLVAGVRLVLEQFEKTLAIHGVEPVPALGAPFDPMLHEAILEDVRDDVPPGTVTEELVRGFRIQDRLLRPSVVKVARATGAGGGHAGPQAPGAGGAQPNLEEEPGP